MAATKTALRLFCLVRFLSEKLVGAISRDTLSKGLPIKVVKKTYKVNEDDDTTSEVEVEEIKGYEVGDDNDTKMISPLAIHILFLIFPLTWAIRFTPSAQLHSNLPSPKIFIT